MTTRDPTLQDDQRALALAGAAWAFLDAESRGVGTEAQAALMVFQASWSQWSDAVLLGDDTAAPFGLRLGSWDVDTRNALRAAMSVVIASAFPSWAETTAALRGMPTDQPPSSARGVWFIRTLVAKVPEHVATMDERFAVLWSCARSVRGRGIDAGADLNRRVFEIAEGLPSETHATGAAAAVQTANQTAAQLIAAAGERATELEPFTITGRAPRAAGSIPWTPIVIGTGVVLLGAGLAAAWANGKIGSRRGLRGLGYVASSEPHPMRDAMRQSRW